MTDAEFAPQRVVGEGDAVLAIQRPACRHGRRNDVDLERHAGRDPFGRARADRRMDPFVMAGQVAGVERRTQAPTSERFCDGHENGVAGDADIGRLVPGDKAVEIGARRFEKRVIMVGDQPGAGGKAAPEADRCRHAIAAAHDPSAGRAQADHRRGARRRSHT